MSQTPNGPVQSSFPTVVYDAIKDSAIEFVLLFGLWILFVSQTTMNEMLAGIAAALVGAVADAVLKAEDFARFKPRLRWLLLITWEVWYVFAGSLAVLKSLVRRLAGRSSAAQLRAVPFRAGGDDAESWARRALAITLVTISPNSIVVGIDVDRNLMLVHFMPATTTPELARRLGARS